MMGAMIRDGFRAKADEMRAKDAAERAEWEAETEPGYPMGSIVEFSLALRELVAAVLESLAGIPNRTLALGLLAYLAVVTVAAIWFR